MNKKFRINYFQFYNGICVIASLIFLIISVFMEGWKYIVPVLMSLYFSYCFYENVILTQQEEKK